MTIRTVIAGGVAVIALGALAPAANAAFGPPAPASTAVEGPSAAAAKHVFRFGPYRVASLPDTGSCGNLWADGPGTVRYVVYGLERNGSRWITVDITHQRLRTMAGESPGACDPQNVGREYPKLVEAGIPSNGRQFQSYPVYGDFDPNATCRPALCDPGVFRVSVFGPDSASDFDHRHYYTRYHAPTADRFQTWIQRTGPTGGSGDICCRDR